MIPGLSNLIDALKDGKTSFIVAGAAASCAAWLIEWPYEWVSYLALVVGVFCIVSIFFQTTEWLWKLYKRRSQRKYYAVFELQDEVQRVYRAFNSIYGSTTEGRVFAGRVTSLYLTLQRQGFRTPDAPPLKGSWSKSGHVSYLETITPYLKPDQIQDARRAAAAYMNESK